MTVEGENKNVCGCIPALPSVMSTTAMIHGNGYCQTKLRLCSSAYASLIMQIGSLRQDIIVQSGLRRYLKVCALVPVTNVRNTMIIIASQLAGFFCVICGIVVI